MAVIKNLVYLSPPVRQPLVQKWLIKWKRKGGEEQRKLLKGLSEAEDYIIDIQEGKIK